MSRGFSQRNSYGGVSHYDSRGQPEKKLLAVSSGQYGNKEADPYDRTASPFAVLS